MKERTRCHGTRASQSQAVRMPEKTWGVFLPTYNPYLREYADHHTILSPKVDSQSQITWAGPLGCFPAKTERNKEVKKKLIKEQGKTAYFAAVRNGEETHLAQLAITIREDEEGAKLVFPCQDCPKFKNYQLQEIKKLKI